MARWLLRVVTDPVETTLPYATPVIKVITSVYTGPAGPEGPQGPPGTGVEALLLEANSSLAAARVVKILPDSSIDYADNTDLGDRRIGLGLTKEAGAPSDLVEILTQGLWTDGAWSWTPEAAVYLGITGHLTQTVPVSPAEFIRVMGVAISADTIFFKPEAPILLA